MTSWIITLALCHVLDGGTTLIGMHRGGTEITPWMPSRPALVVTVQIGGWGAQAIALPKLARTHPKLAKGLAAASVGVSCGVGVWNLGQLTRQTRSP